MDLRLALLLACFFLSGFAALLYQTAWTRELSFVFGTSELAVAAVLAAYMGGLALGAAGAARYAQRLRRPVLAYGVLELAIAVCALSVPVGIRLIDGLYVGLLGGGSELPQGGASWAAVFQLAAAFAVLLPPTAFMGATLPLLARHAVRRESEIGSRVGLLYAVNTAGAIAGTVVAAFWLMPALGLRHTVWMGAVLNGVVFALAALLARGVAALPAPSPAKALDAPAGENEDGGWILPLIAVSGAVSFAYEVMWTRLLGHLLGASLQAFATMLASFLLGIALGSAVAARVATDRKRAAFGFAVAQLCIALGSYAGLAVAALLPELASRLGAGPDAPLASAAVAAMPLLPITLCIGATFPFAVRVVAGRPELAARATARVYAWNTVGAIAGALGAGFVLLPELGFHGTLGVGVATSLVLAALTALLTRPRRTRLAGLAAAAGVALVAVPPKPPWPLLISSPLTRRPERGTIVFSAVGRSSTVMVFDQGAGYRIATNGLPESTIERKGVLPQDNVARWLGLLPTLLRPDTRELLVVGFGGGMALEPVPSTVASIDVIELEPEVVAANQRIGTERAIDPLQDPRVRVTIGDARGALQLTQKRFDAIVSQPSHPWTAGASHLYTREFFSLARSRLAPGGVFVQWIGLNFVDASLLRSLVATLADVFTYVEVYQPQLGGFLFAASDAPLGLGGVEAALRDAREDYARFGIDRLEDVAAVRFLDDGGARALGRGAPLNTDDDNQLASRAARLGPSALDAKSAHALVKDLDPLLAGGHGLDPLLAGGHGLDPLLAGGQGLDAGALIRALMDRRFQLRAQSLAESWQGAEAEIARGWIEVGQGQSSRGARHFARARELAPGDPEPIAGLVASRSVALSRGVMPSDLEGVELAPTEAALVAGWQRGTADDWDAVAALDPVLAELEPGDALFDEAARLRIRWRLETGEASAKAEALALAEALLSRRWRANDALLHAAAALQAGRPEMAWGSLSRIARLPRGPQSRSAALRALPLAQALPPELARDLPARLARRAGRSLMPAGAAAAPAAVQEVESPAGASSATGGRTQLSGGLERLPDAAP